MGFHGIGRKQCNKTATKGCVISVDVCFSSNEYHALFSHRRRVAVQVRCFVRLRLIGDVRSGGHEILRFAQDDNRGSSDD